MVLSVTILFGSLVQNTFEDLEDSGCVKMNEESVEPMMLGSIASQYYLKYTTVSMFGSNIGPNTSLEVKIPTYYLFNFHVTPILSNVSPHFFLLLQVFLHILSGSSEYDELPVRHNEVIFQL